MLNNFDIFRYRLAGMSNAGVRKLVKFYQECDKKLSLRQIGQLAEVKSLSNFMENYREQDARPLFKNFKKFRSFSLMDDCYPERLREIYDAPALLFYKGDLGLLKYSKIAFVGSRNATAVGMKAVEKLIQELRGQFVIVSGLARGIDAASHLAAVKSGTPTIAVIGTGLDVYYPNENRALQDYLGKNQLILSEYAPGEKALKFHFPSRNRIIAGLARGVVVLEAELRSGSLITAERAMEEGRDVFAVPGNIIEGHSAGCHHLIQQGAKLTFSAKDILEEYALFL